MNPEDHSLFTYFFLVIGIVGVAWATSEAFAFGGGPAHLGLGELDAAREGTHQVCIDHFGELNLSKWTCGERIFKNTSMRANMSGPPVTSHDIDLFICDSSRCHINWAAYSGVKAPAIEEPTIVNSTDGNGMEYSEPVEEERPPDRCTHLIRHTRIELPVTYSWYRDPQTGFHLMPNPVEYRDAFNFYTYCTTDGYYGPELNEAAAQIRNGTSPERVPISIPTFRDSIHYIWAFPIDGPPVMMPIGDWRYVLSEMLLIAKAMKSW